MDILLNGQYYVGLQRYNINENNERVETLQSGDLLDAILATIEAQKNNALASLNIKKIESADDYKVSVYNAQIDAINAAYEKALNDLDRMETDVLWNYNTHIFEPILANTTLSLQAEIAALQRSLDNEAGKVREIAISKGTLVNQEYLLAYDEASKWVKDGSNDSEVPESLSVWAEVGNITNAAAAADIIATRNMFNAGIVAVRTIRLTGKSEIAKATTVKIANDTYKVFLAKLAIVAEQVTPV